MYQLPTQKLKLIGGRPKQLHEVLSNPGLGNVGCGISPIGFKDERRLRKDKLFLKVFLSLPRIFYREDLIKRNMENFYTFLKYSDPHVLF